MSSRGELLFVTKLLHLDERIFQSNTWLSEQLLVCQICRVLCFLLVLIVGQALILEREYRVDWLLLVHRFVLLWDYDVQSWMISNGNLLVYSIIVGLGYILFISNAWFLEHGRWQVCIALAPLFKLRLSDQLLWLGEPLMVACWLLHLITLKILVEHLAK